MDKTDRQSVTFSEVADETSDNESSDDDYYTDDDLCALTPGIRNFGHWFWKIGRDAHNLQSFNSLI